MVFTASADPDGNTAYFVDGYEVPQSVYDTLFPSKLFPSDTGLSLAEAEAALAKIVAETPAPEPHKGPYFNLAIDGAHPLKSEALAVHSKQIPAVMARNKKHGLNIRYDRMGRPVFTDAGQRRALMKIEGAKQMNSYYGA